jgi:multidrug efflux pump subunit AcrB
MKITLKPKTDLGKFSVGLNSFFLFVIAIYVLCVWLLNVLTFESYLWEVTEIIVFPLSIIGFIVGIRAIKENKEHSGLVFLSILIGLCTILYIVLN